MGVALKYYRYAVVLPGIGVPLTVFLLLLYPNKVSLGTWTEQLPSMHAAINGTTALLLLVAWMAIKKKNVALHKKIMLSCMGLGVLFVVSYVLFHLSSEPTRYGDANHDGVLSPEELQAVGTMRYVYLCVLLSHIVLAVPVVFLVMKAVFYAYHGSVKKHKKIAQYALPIWLYVSVTGVLIYYMVAPYYLPHQ